MKIDEKLVIIEKYNVYNKLLNENQKELFEEYFFEDISIIEISNEKKISKNAVYKTIKNTIKKLDYFETNLKIISNNKYNVEFLRGKKISEEIILKLK